MFKKLRIFKRLKELEKEKSVTNKAFGILVSEINKLKGIQRKTSIPENKKDMTPEEFMKWFISNP